MITTLKLIKFIKSSVQRVMIKTYYIVMDYILYRCQKRTSKMKERRNTYIIDFHSIFLDINFFKFMSSVDDESLSFERRKPSSIGVRQLNINIVYNTYCIDFSRHSRIYSLCHYKFRRF